jgi:urease accessory protein
VHRAGEAGETAALAANRATGTVALEVGARAGRSHRTRVGESGSLRVRFPGEAGPTLEAVVINTAGGCTGGDRFAIDVTVGANASLLITTASAEKVYRSLGDDATLAVTLRVARGARMAWMPRETILFDRARLARTIDVDLADDAQLLLAEAMVFGRAGMGEAVETGRLSDRWRVRRGGRLVYAESIGMDGAVAAKLAKPAVAGGGIALATLLMAPADERFVAALRASALDLRGEVGVSSWNGLTAARFCARDGESLRHDMILALGLALGGPLPRLWLN